MILRAFVIFSVILANLVLGSVARAWGDMGHQVVGEIAQQLLRSDKQTSQAVQDILGVEPWSIAATWPDKVRSDIRFKEFDAVHFINDMKDPFSAYTVLTQWVELIKDTRAPREIRMIAMRYIIHVLGDVHQPLHVGFAIDRGGNNCKVIWNPTPNYKKEQNLHAVWDTDLVMSIVSDMASGSGKFISYSDLATSLMKKYKKMLGNPLSVNVNQWLNESHGLAEAAVYPDKLAPEARPYCKPKNEWNKIAKEDIPVLSADYIKLHKPIIEEQLVRSGVRLAAFLRQTFRNAPVSKLDEDEILKFFFKVR